MGSRLLQHSIFAVALWGTVGLPCAAATIPGPRVLGRLHLIGPPLTALCTKLADPNWLVAWLLNPSHLRPGARMRDFNLTVDEAQVVASYLYVGALPDREVRWQGGNARIGERLFVSRGCRGCHVIEDSETSALSRAPSLAGIGLKVRGDWLFEWLKSPRAYDPNTSMPRLALSDDDIRHLVAFLLSHREGAEVIASTPGFEGRVAPDVARSVMRRLDCAKCHLIAGVQTVEPSHGWRVAPASCASCHEVSGSSLPLAWRDGTADGDGSASALEDGRRLVEYYNCRGCHRIEGSGGVIADYLERKTLAPPTLEGEGARVQPSWLIDFLQRPVNLRPWLHIRMPDFGLSAAEAAALARYFAALSRVPPRDEPCEGTPHRTIALGRRRFAHFKCVQCHATPIDDHGRDGMDDEDLSIDLLLAKTRLRPSWVREFLARPKALVGMETRMPTAFYSTDGLPKVEHPERDITAIAGYLMQMTEAPQAAAGSTDAGQDNGDGQQIDWSKYVY